MLRAELVDVGLFSSQERFGDLCIHAVIDLRRAFVRAELERAMLATIEVFPVLGRRYVPGFWRDRWHEVPDPVSNAVHVIEQPSDLEAETVSWARRAIDPTRDAPLRLVSLGRDGGSRLIVSITHVAVDGGGAAAVGHVLGAKLYGVSPSAPVDSRRSVASALAGLGLRHLPVLALDMARAVALPLQMAGVAKRERQFPRAAPNGASWRHLTISAGEVERIKATCRPRGASINDALIAALARVSAGRSSGGSVAVMYTMDLRRYAGTPRLTAANTSTILSVIVPRGAISDLGSTAAAVAKVTARHRRGLAGPASVLAPLTLGLGAPHAWARRLMRLLHPVLIDLPLSRGLIFTNVGRIDEGLEAFGADIEQLRVIGPNIEGVPVPAVVAYGFRGELCLELFGAPGLAPEALDELERELRHALELSGPPA